MKKPKAFNISIQLEKMCRLFQNILFTGKIPKLNSGN